MMKKILKYISAALAGAAYGALAVVLSRLLIRNLASLLHWVGGAAGLDGELLSYGVQVLEQLRSAALLSPWLPAMLIGGCYGALTAWLIRRRRKWKIIAALLAGLLLLIPCALAALWFTSVNGIFVCSLIRVLLPLIPQLL